MRLDKYQNKDFDRGGSRPKEILWVFISGLIFSSWLPGSTWRCYILRFFGATIGAGVVIKPRVRIKFPWRLSIGSHSWIGEDVWIDNLAFVSIGESTCLSQGVYVCTGSHDWSDLNFKLITKPVKIGNRCWIAAKASLAPGTEVQDGCVITMGKICFGTMAGDCIHLPDGTKKNRVVS